jgi:hypothetical protein
VTLTTLALWNYFRFIRQAPETAGTPAPAAIDSGAGR